MPPRVGTSVLADHGSMNCRLTDHVDLLFQDCTIHIVNFCCHIAHIYVYVFVCFVFAIYYDLQVHFHIMSWINIHSNTSVIDRYHRDWCLHHYPYRMKICIEGLKVLVSHTVSHSHSSLTWTECSFHSGKAIMPLCKNSGQATLDWSWEWLTVRLAVWA